MIQRRWLQLILFLLLAAATLLGGSIQASAADRASAALKPAKVGGKWQIAWDVRAGTIYGVLSLKQHADQIIGTFYEELNRQTYSLSGNIQGNDITFDIPFPSSRPYTIEFTGTIDRKKMSGTSKKKGGGPVYLGHAGEVDDPQRSWLAIKDFRHRLVTPRKPPKEDDDD